MLGKCVQNAQKKKKTALQVEQIMHQFRARLAAPCPSTLYLVVGDAVDQAADALFHFEVHVRVEPRRAALVKEVLHPLVWAAWVYVMCTRCVRDVCTMCTRCVHMRKKVRKKEENTKWRRRSVDSVGQAP